MNVLVINCGSSSVKYQLIDTKTGEVSAKGNVERIGFEDAVFTHTTATAGKVERTIPVPNHTVAIQHVLASLTGPGGVVKNLSGIGAVGHRFVNGGRYFVDSVLVDDSVLDGLNAIRDLAPLHNPAHMLGIEAALAAMPDTPQVVVFDTAFHATIAPEAYLYALPARYHEEYGIRRYGFHGTSHFYVSRRAAELAGRPVEDLKIITCHLGNGASIDAVRGGKAIETSMGFTPLEGLVMGTRTGDIDAAAVLYIMKKEGLSPEQMDVILNKQSGMLALSEISSDMREVVNAAKNGDGKARLALDIYCHRIRKYIGAYFAHLGGLDVLVFTAGVGEYSPLIREKVCDGLGCLGIDLDPDRNRAAMGGEHVITRDGSPVTVFVIPTNEEIVIAREAERMAGA